MKLLKNLKNNWPVTALLFLTVVTRFGGLIWCFPYAPHPDEWNMAAAITRLNWRESLNPHFFAYGQFPLYLAYFSALFYNLIPWIKIKIIDIPEAIFFLRFWSAVAGTGVVYLVYLISKKLFFKRPLITPLLAVFTPGLIQISHFGTTESLLSFFLLWIIYLSIKIVENQKLKYFFLLAIPLGLSFGSKITALTFTVPVIIGFILNFKKISSLKKYLITLTLTLALALLCSPYLILAFKESRGTLLYETSVATGKSAIFYTRQFIATVPVLFQLQNIFPYALGWPIFIFGSLGFLISPAILIKKALKKKKFSFCDRSLFIIHCSFLMYFLSQAFLFTKWTRFMSPLFAFFPIFTGLFFGYLSNLRYLRNLSYLFVAFAVIPGILFSTIYFFPNIRFTASEWIYKNIPSGSQILYDTGNVVDLPIVPPKSSYRLSAIDYRLTSFDFYHLDENPELFPKLLNYLENSNYVIVPSRRIFISHLRSLEKFPLTAKYYEMLFSGKLGFAPVAKIEPFYSKIFKDEQAEETFSVFDHPTVRIYKKYDTLSKIQYETLFKD